MEKIGSNFYLPAVFAAVHTVLKKNSPAFIFSYEKRLHQKDEMNSHVGLKKNLSSIQLPKVCANIK